MTKLFRIEHNIETGEVSKIQLTDEEIANAQNDEVARIARLAAENKQAFVPGRNFTNRFFLRIKNRRTSDGIYL